MSHVSVQDTVAGFSGVARTGHRSTRQCRALARAFLAELIGSPPVALRWDGCHRLMGEVCIHGCELVVIAPRDAAHHPVVLTALDWDEIRRASAEERSTLLGRYAIVNNDQLAAMLARNDLVPTAR